MRRATVSRTALQPRCVASAYLQMMVVARTNSPPASADVHNEERDCYVLTRDRENRERMEQLVVAEHVRNRVRPAPRVDDGTRGVAEPSGHEKDHTGRAQAHDELWQRHD